MITLYVIQLKPGLFSKGSYWRSTADISKAKFYGGTGAARGAISYHRENWERKGYTPVILKVEARVVEEFAA